eukprot:15478911-Alexandrium_andersonii.AAC.1
MRRGQIPHGRCIWRPLVREEQSLRPVGSILRSFRVPAAFANIQDAARCPWLRLSSPVLAIPWAPLDSK